MWDVYFIPHLGTSGFAITVFTRLDFFSAPLPAISSYLSPDHISCIEGGVSSAVAACRAPARKLNSESYNLKISKIYANESEFSRAFTPLGGFYSLVKYLKGHLGNLVLNNQIIDFDLIHKKYVPT